MAYVAHKPATPPKMQRNPFATHVPSKRVMDALAESALAKVGLATGQATATCGVCYTTPAANGTCMC